MPVEAHVAREVLGERHLGALLDERCRDFEAVVRIDAPLARPGDRRPLLEREPGRVREQVPERRAGRARRLVEIDEPLLGGDEHSPPRSRASSPTPRGSGARASPYVASTAPVTPATA